MEVQDLEISTQLVQLNFEEILESFSLLLVFVIARQAYLKCLY